MQHSEFWQAVDQVFGSAYGRSLTVDLVLPCFGVNAVSALERGEPALAVWQELVRETEQDQSALWIHRQEKKKSNSPRRR